MNRLASIRVGAVFASLVMALAGCDCGKVDCTKTPTEPMCTCDTTDLTASFTTPKDGDTVEQTSNVQVTLARRGTAVTVGTAKLEIRGPGATTFGASRDGVADGANASFSGVQLQPGENALRATVSEANCTGTAPAVTIVVTAKNNVTPPPVVLGCDFPQDTNTDGVLNATELPTGQAVSVRVRTQNGSGATFSAPNSSPASAPIMNETATLTVPGPTADGTFAVTGTVTRGTGMPTCNASIRVQRAAGCTVENTTSILPRGPLDDADRATPGYQVRANAQLNSGAVDRAELVGGGTTRAIAFAVGVASADFTVPSTGTQNFEVALNAFDLAGNRCTTVNGSRIIPLDFEAPTVAITSPVSGATVTAPTIMVTASVVGADGGSCQLFVDGVAGPTATVATGTVSLSVSFPGSGTYGLRVECSDGAGNRGSSATMLADGGLSESRVIVQLPTNVCSVTFASVGGEAAMCPAFVSRLTAGNLSVTLNRSTNCPTQPLRLFKDGIQLSGAGPTFLVPVGAVTANFTLRAEIDNLPGATTATTSTSCAIDVDTNVPTITEPNAPTSGPLVINAVGDDPLIAGAQRRLAFTAAVPAMARVDVCVDSAAAAGVGAPACSGPTGWFVLSTNVTSPRTAFTLPEGTYNLKIVVVGAGNPPPESSPLPLNVDVTVPCVSGGGLTLPQDGTNDGGTPDARLNLAELGSNQPRVQFAVDPACGTATTAVVKSIAGGIVGSTAYAPALTNPTGTVNVDLTQNVAPEQDLRVFVELTDAVGNVNRPSSNAPAQLAFRVDRQAPACAFTEPASGRTLNLIDIPAGSVTARVQTSTDVLSVPIAEGASSQNVTPNGAGLASAPFAVTGTRTLAFTASCRDQSGNLGPAANRSVDIDLDAPSFVLTAPATGANSNTTSILTTAAMVTGANGNPVVIRSSAQAIDVGSLTSAQGYSATLVYPIGMNQTITARVVDAAGNEAVRTATNVNVSSTTCQIVLTATNARAPFVRGPTTWLNRGHVPGVGASSGTATINANSSNCRLGEAVTLSRVSPSGGPTIPAGTTSGSGDVTFNNVPLSDGEVWSLTIQNNPVPATFSVDLVAPTPGTFRINADAAAPPASIFFVASTNNERVKANAAGYYADGDGNSGNGAQATFSVAGVTSAINGTVEFSIGGTLIANTTQNVASSPQTFNGITVNLAQNLAGEFAAVVVDEGGNSVDLYRGPVIVDVIPPSAPSGIDAGVLDARGASGSIAWLNDAVDDVGVAGSGAVTRYVVKWTTGSVPGNNSMATSDDFFGASSSDAIERVPTGSQMAETLTLPPLNTYFMAVRTRDEVHNYSTFGGPLSRDNLWTRIKLDGPAGSSFGNAVVSESSLNNDAIIDLVVGASTGTIPGALYIYYGSGGIASQATCVAPACQTLTAPDSTGTGYAADFSAAGNAGDSVALPSAVAKADLLVGQSNFPNSTVPVGRAFLYFGSDSANQLSATPFIEFRGADNAGRIGNTVKIIPDLNGDGFEEVALTAPFANSNNGVVFIYQGRTIGAWQTARTATDGTTMAPYIPVSSATATWTILGGAVVPTPTSGYFGRNRFGVARLGDLDGDGRGDFTIGLGPETINRMQLWTSAVVAPASAPIPNASRLQDLSQTVGTSSNATTGFSAFVVGGINVLNGPAQDLVVSWPARAGGGTVFIYADLGPTGAPSTASYSVVGPLTFGSSVGVANLNTADSRPDLVVGTTNTSNSLAWVVWQQAGTTAFDSSLGSSTPVFWTSRFDGNVLSASTNNSLGRSNAAADVSGDSRADVVLADERNNAVYVWR